MKRVCLPVRCTPYCPTKKPMDAKEVTSILKKIPEPVRLLVEEVTLDFSDSMHQIVSACFPKAMITLDRFPAYTNSAGYLPLTQTINAMVMENLFFLVHVYHVLTNYTLQCSYESPYI